MKGMEGEADANQDDQIKASELRAYAEQNVLQQSSGSQRPELQGDRERVLVMFQQCRELRHECVFTKVTHPDTLL